MFIKLFMRFHIDIQNNMICSRLQGMRGGVVVIEQRYAEASGDSTDENGMKVQLVYLDANNLYGHAMIQALPTGGFQVRQPQLNILVIRSVVVVG